MPTAPNRLPRVSAENSYGFVYKKVISNRNLSYSFISNAAVLESVYASLFAQRWR